MGVSREAVGTVSGRILGRGEGGVGVRQVYGRVTGVTRPCAVYPEPCRQIETMASDDVSRCLAEGGSARMDLDR
jgi:hypothetical protein